MAVSQERTLRSYVLDIHLYLSLALGLLLVAIALTGAPLVWRDQVDRLLNPERYAVTGSDSRLTPSGYAANALAAAGMDFRVVDVRYPVAPGWPVRANLRAAPRDGGGVRSLTVTLDPATGKALGVARVSSTFVGFLHNVHHMLMIPQFSGRQIVGWIGVAMLFLSLSGLYLWWPRNVGFVRGLRWSRSPFTTTNLHHLAGFWISFPLAVVSLTGIYLAFPNTAYSFMSSLATMGQPMRHGGFSALPARETNIDADRAFAQALAAAPDLLHAFAHPLSLLAKPCPAAAAAPWNLGFYSTHRARNRFASPAVTASRWSWVPAGSPRTSPGTGSTTEKAGAPTGGPAAVRSVCSSDIVPEWSTSGHGRPVVPAATES